MAKKRKMAKGMRKRAVTHRSTRNFARARAAIQGAGRKVPKTLALTSWKLLATKSPPR